MLNLKSLVNNIFGRKPMTAFDRREILRAVLSGAIVATGLVAMTHTAESAPLMKGVDDHAMMSTLIEQAQASGTSSVRRTRHGVRARECKMVHGKKMCRRR